MPIKPWYKLTTPREDLRDGRPLDASEFAVHLDQIRDARAPAVYQDPERFFERTFLTKGLSGLAAEVIRRLSGEKTETSAVFNLTTQFGGGKTHALTVLYHLAKHGGQAKHWQGVPKLFELAKVDQLPHAKVAVFVGTEFDPISGRGGNDGTPSRKTPWGEIAYQLGGEPALAILAEHEKQATAPGGDVIRAFIPNDKPVLILMDELMNFVTRSRKSGLATQFYSFLHNLSEEARGRDNMVLAVSIPASELEMTAEDQSDYERFKKLLDRVGRPVMMSAEAETSEIIRRRLFEWDSNVLTPDGRIMLTRDALATCNDYADWVKDHKNSVPEWFPVDSARDAFAATYPFHPTVLSVFERKWQVLPRFQQTRGVLRLLALWVSKAYQEGFKGGQREGMIGLGTAPLDDPQFRAAMFEQLGDHRLEAAVTTDICGKKDAHAIRLDTEADDTLRKSRLHRKIATTIFFESNGGMTRNECTIPELRLAVAEPDSDIGNIETVLEALTEACYYLTVDRNRYHFSFKENLNKRYADRRANIKGPAIRERVQLEVRTVFATGNGIERLYFPEKSNQIPDRAVLTFVILSPDMNMEDEARTKAFVESVTRENGSSSRTFKSALVFCVAQSAGDLQELARRLLAWEEIGEELPSISIDESQRHQLSDNLKKAKRDLKEAVWRTYKNVMILGKDNGLRCIDLGLVHSSAAETLLQFIMTYLRQNDEIQTGISPSFLVRNWSPAFKEWSTKSVRDAFYASPLFPRILNPDTIKDTIARGVENGLLAYVGKTPNGRYEPFIFEKSLNAADIEISDDMYVITKETADTYRSEVKETLVKVDGGETNTVSVTTTDGDLFGKETTPTPVGPTSGAGKEAGQGHNPQGASMMAWSGEISPQKWMNFYTRVLAKFATGNGLKLSVKIEVAPDGGVSQQKIDETRAALRELGLNDKLE